MFRKKSHGLRLLFLLLLLVMAGITLWLSRSLEVEAIIGQVSQFGALSWLVFFIIYAVGTVLFFPGALLTLAGGALFGPVVGTLINLTSATAGAALAFLVARYFSSDWAESKAGGRLSEIRQGVDDEGWRFVAFVRLVPLFPFNLLNYALGLTRIPFLHYLLATYIAMLPGAVAYTYLGYVGREAAGGSADLVQKGLLALALLAVVAFLPRLVRRLRKDKSVKNA